MARKPSVGAGRRAAFIIPRMRLGPSYMHKIIFVYIGPPQPHPGDEKGSVRPVRLLSTRASGQIRFRLFCTNIFS